MANKFDILDSYKKIYKTSIETPNIAYHLIDKHSNSNLKDKIALLWIGNNEEEEAYTFIDLYKLSNKFANMMISMGVQKGEVVVLFIDNLPELYIGFLGAIKTGAVITYISSNIDISNLKKRLIDLKAKIILTTPELRSKLSNIIFELFDLQHIVVVNRNPLHYDSLDISDLDYYQEMNKNSTDFDIIETFKKDISIIYYYSNNNNFVPIVISHENLLNYYLVSSCVLENGMNQRYFSNVSIDDINFINFSICYPWVRGSTNLVFESMADTQNTLAIIEREKVNIICIDESSIINLDELAVYEYCTDSIYNIRLFRLVIFNSIKDLFLDNKYQSNNYIFADSKSGNVLAFNKLGLDIDRGYLGVQMIGQELQIESQQINNRFGELEINVSKSLFFHRYFNKNENANIDIDFKNYDLGLIGYIDNKGDIYIET